jgi:hypothetical protein
MTRRMSAVPDPDPLWGDEFELEGDGFDRRKVYGAKSRDQKPGGSCQTVSLTLPYSIYAALRKIVEDKRKHKDMPHILRDYAIKGLHDERDMDGGDDPVLDLALKQALMDERTETRMAYHEDVRKRIANLKIEIDDAREQADKLEALIADYEAYIEDWHPVDQAKVQAMLKGARYDLEHLRLREV